MRLWRVFVFSKICILSVLVAAAGLACLRLFEALAWKQAEQRLWQFRSKFLQCMCRLIVVVFGIRIGAAASDSDHFGSIESEKPRLILANHISYLDIIIIASKRPCVFLAKEEVRRWPVIGFIAEGLGCEFVDRNSLSSKVATLRKIRRRLGHTSVCVFPEGTTSAAYLPSGLNWQEGQVWSAQTTGKQLELFALHYVQHSEMVWIDDMSFLPHFWKVLAMPKIDVVMSSALRKIAKNTEQQAARSVSRRAYAEISSMCRSNSLAHGLLCDAGKKLLPMQSEAAF